MYPVHDWARQGIGDSLVDLQFLTRDVQFDLLAQFDATPSRATPGSCWNSRRGGCMRRLVTLFRIRFHPQRIFLRPLQSSLNSRQGVRESGFRPRYSMTKAFDVVLETAPHGMGHDSS